MLKPEDLESKVVKPKTIVEGKHRCSDKVRCPACHVVGKLKKATPFGLEIEGCRCHKDRPK